MIGPIAICVHSYKGVDFDGYFNHLWCIAHWAQKYDLVFIGKPGLDAATARNAIIDRAIEKKCTHALFMDEDHFFPRETLDCLYEAATMDSPAAMVSGLVCKKGDGYQQVCWEIRDTKDGLQYYSITLPLDCKTYQTNVCAFGCTLINLEAIQKLKKPYFRDTCEAGPDGVPTNVRSDVNLCLAFRAIGEKIFVDTRVLIGHDDDKGTVVYPHNAAELLSLRNLEKSTMKLKEGQSGFYYTPGD